MRDRRAQPIACRTALAVFCWAVPCCVFGADTVEGALGRQPAVVALQLQPPRLVMTERRWPHSVLVSGLLADSRQVDLSGEVSIVSADESIARADGTGWVHAVGPGATHLTISAAGLAAELPVEVAVKANAGPLSFRHDVMPVLSKAGCNQGACHGYSLGKNGFKLSLRGGDAGWDYRAMTREQFGRRVNPQHPAASLLLAKPLGALPHGGGIRLEEGGLLHRLLLEWIDAQAPGDLEGRVELASVAVYPQRVVLDPGREQPLQVIARYSDGTARDVTRLAVFTSNAELLAEVDEAGRIRAAGQGETAIVVRYERVFDVCNVMVTGEAAGFVAAEVPQDNLVDRHVTAKLNEVRIAPSATASDVEFLRRVSIDLVGLQPTPAEVRAFMNDASPDKRATAVEELLGRPRFVDYWTLKWGDLLQNSRNRLSNDSMWALREWLKSAVASNMPMDQFARGLLTGEGSYRDDPAAAYFLISEDENDTLERVTQVFCGVRMLCAKCHHHPFENWTQADYYGLAGFFNQVMAKPDPLNPADGKARVVWLDLGRGYAINPRSGAPEPPRLLGSGAVEVAAGLDRREVYARWLTSADNPFFARSLVNRFWSYFFHRGIIEPVDDLRNTNPPINPSLLQALTDDFVAGGYDLRRLMRLIVLSRTYQRSSEANASNAADELNFSRALPRRLKAEVLLDCLVQATGVAEEFGDAPAGFSAAQLPDANVQSELLSLFGKPRRAEACECERIDSSNMQQALEFINGAAVLSRVAKPQGRVAQLTAAIPANELLIEELYLWSLARPPTDAESRVALKHFESYGAERNAAAQDLMWALLNSKDFLFND